MGIELKPISQLSGMSFFIPSYQRGYRWTVQQVKDLLNDIYKFEPKDDYSFYCLQPIVVKNRNCSCLNIEGLKPSSGSEWEVIDGQQRLTTIFLILEHLKKIVKLNFDEPIEYTLKYETRENSEEFLKEVARPKKHEDKDINIDYFHILKAYEYIKEWFKEKDANSFAEKLLYKTKVIWYEAPEGEDAVAVFTRINMWKIPLTNAELVKALFLNRQNFGEDEKLQRLRQQEIAMQWDEIEYSLRDDNMWFFFNRGDYNKPTRIDVILDMMYDRDDLKVKDDIKVKKDNEEGWEQEVLGNDGYKTFRYFYYYFNEMPDNKEGDTVLKWEKGWMKIKEIFQTFEDWYDDIECYHYVSFLIDQGVKIEGLLEKWNQNTTRQDFIDSLKVKIKEKIRVCNDLDKQYETNGGPAKTTCRPLLLLYNIQTVISKTRNLKAKYRNKGFERFPFYIYEEENWEIEHIDSNTTNKLEDHDSQKEWLLNVYNSVYDEKEQKRIEELVKELDNNGSLSSFNVEKLEKELHIKKPDTLDEDEKNQVMNFTLLDAHTNKSYGNSIFSAKRRVIIGKDESVKIILQTPKEGSVFFEKKGVEDSTPFIPPCTRNVFLKYYSTVHTDPNYWTKDDARAYKKDIFYTLKQFGVTSNEITKAEGQNNGQ